MRQGGSLGAAPLAPAVPSFSPELTRHLRAGPELMVALDIDGTLVRSDGTVSVAVRDAVREVLEAGTNVVLATGRSIAGVLPVLDELGLERAWVVASNGAVCARVDPLLPGGHEITDVVTFDPEPALRLLRGFLPESLFAVEKAGEGFLVSHPFPPGELSGPVVVADFDQLCESPASRVTIRDLGLDARDFREVVERSGLAGVTYAIGWTAWLDLTPPGVTKASGLEIIRERVEVARGATVAVGDGHNDIEMLRWARVGVAMGGADAETASAADAVARHVDEDGLVLVLHSLLP
jgi:hydroxymethylpyrimidine pyrophosphatase-like HAD family hydrolase